MRSAATLMTADVGCSICGAVVPGYEVGRSRPVPAIQAFVEARGLDAAALCRACACGAVPSPCISLCALDDDKRGCRGCGRTVDEISGWSGMDTAQRCAVRLRLRASS